VSVKVTVYDYSISQGKPDKLLGNKLIDHLLRVYQPTPLQGLASTCLLD